jgi:hypothetical protein
MAVARVMVVAMVAGCVRHLVVVPQAPVGRLGTIPV